MSEAVIAQKKPYFADVEAGKEYWWCACGKSAKQPFCDGSHKGSDFSAVQYKATETKAVMLCGCKHTKNPPRCDGSHSRL